ncbi:DUF4832 domain-containing protein [candidate division KSB1 bacterium]|nr:DUF4832 domain-containing protein [candidate division KSB1 bacterium]
MKAKQTVKRQLRRAMSLFYLLLLANLSFPGEINMKHFWDDQIALENPHKGWYHHFPDNHINKYIIENDVDLTEFPGMDHLYMRLSWAYLEPVEGQFNWHIIDQHIEKWTANGLGIAFRLSCRETSSDRIEQQFATPRWVIEAGAKGDFWLRGEKVGADGPWEPIFDDPIYLEKLENFIRAFAQRYDGTSWLRYVDIGSIGDWGEGHTHSGSRLLYNYAQRKQHVDLYLKYFVKTQLAITDDFVYNIKNPDERQKMHQYIVENGITYRDDSPLVDYYIGAYPKTYTVRSPEYFADVYRTKPTIFELEHYGTVKRLGNWTADSGSAMAEHGDGKTGPDFFRGALELLHASYIGYHGYAHEWLADNPELTVELLNRCGYWYFLHSVDIPDQVRASDNVTVKMTWENRGVAPAYNAYDLVLRLAGPETVTFNMPAGNLHWRPSESSTTFVERYLITLPKNLQLGKYDLSIKLYSPQASRTVYLPFNPQIKDAQDFYKITEVTVFPPAE